MNAAQNCLVLEKRFVPYAFLATDKYKK